MIQTPVGNGGEELTNGPVKRSSWAVAASSARHSPVVTQLAARTSAAAMDRCNGGKPARQVGKHRCDMGHSGKGGLTDHAERLPALA
ncbi:hypothetical protein GCM10007235_22990 [Pseudoxanthomonas indica]|nr:hypothetical protein GCM10007235_22990 [Pseudoxanthomonas indica]